MYWHLNIRLSIYLSIYLIPFTLPPFLPRALSLVWPVTSSSSELSFSHTLIAWPFPAILFVHYSGVLFYLSRLPHTPHPPLNFHHLVLACPTSSGCSSPATVTLTPVACYPWWPNVAHTQEWWGRETANLSQFILGRSLGVFPRLAPFCAYGNPHHYCRYDGFPLCGSVQNMDAHRVIRCNGHISD